MTLAAIAPTPAIDRRAALHRLLDDSLQLPPEYAAGMASHLPMALAALDALGAGEARLRAFYATYARRLQQGARPRGSTPALAAGPGDGWKSLRGLLEAFDTFRAHFAAALAARGCDAVLRDALPALMAGAAGAAFHGPIRIAHAIESAHAGELAAALAYAAARWKPLPAPQGASERFEDASAWLDALDARQHREDAAWRPTASLISDRMQQAAQTRAYLELAGGLDAAAVEGDVAALMRDLARTAAARYAVTGNFTVLHMATATRAAQVLAAWLPTAGAAWCPLLHAVAAASLASRAVPLQRDASDRPLAWPDVRRLACASDDDHVIKLVHSMVAQHELAPHEVWLAAARTAVRA